MSLFGADKSAPYQKLNQERRILLERLENILQSNNLEEGFNLLTKREKDIITLYYLDGYIDREIASHYKVTRENIYKLRKNGLNKLKKNRNI